MPLLHLQLVTDVVYGMSNSILSSEWGIGQQFLQMNIFVEIVSHLNLEKIKFWDNTLK